MHTPKDISPHMLGEDAWRALMSGHHTRWERNIQRLADTPTPLHHVPKFTLDPDATFFCIGSCFARNIEEHLIYRGRRVLSKSVLSPVAEWGGRTNGFLNKFTTQSMLNEVMWALNPPAFDASFFDILPDGWLDLQLCPGMGAVSAERAVERHHYLSTTYFQRLRQSSVVILTLGLNEVWQDRASGLYLNAAPSLHSVRRQPDRYRCVFTTVDDHLAALAQLRTALLQLNPAVHIILTVSPVPMSQTFSGLDVAVANTYSKAVLRAAAAMFANRHANVDYFPSFDMIHLAPRDAAYAADCLHVSNRAVGSVMGAFLQLYTGMDTPAPDFTELGYLAANPDVDAAVRREEWESGFAHWCATGRAEGRRLIPESGPTPLMILGGAV